MTSRKLDILIDGQFGSTGKGLLAEYIARSSPYDFTISNLSPNAGHTFTWRNQLHVSKQIPVVGLLSRRSTIYLTAASIINPELLVKECRDFGVDTSRVFIHPRAAVITEEDRLAESRDSSSATKLASTQQGVGEALARKVQRSCNLAGTTELLQDTFQVQELPLSEYLDQGCTALMETSQGFDLSLNSGLSYPYCTSREITVSEALSAAQLHPKYLGQTYMSMRLHPIRVGNIISDEGEVLGESGPFYPDSVETTWNQLQLRDERTTVTKRVRRVATFSMQQYRRSLAALQPSSVFLNFMNYATEADLPLLKQLASERFPNLVGVGSSVKDVYEVRSKTHFLEVCQTVLGERNRRAVGLNRLLYQDCSLQR